jgi:hypothetical protein
MRPAWPTGQSHSSQRGQRANTSSAPPTYANVSHWSRSSPKQAERRRQPGRDGPRDDAEHDRREERPRVGARVVEQPVPHGQHPCDEQDQRRARQPAERLAVEPRHVIQPRGQQQRVVGLRDRDLERAVHLRRGRPPRMLRRERSVAAEPCGLPLPAQQRIQRSGHGRGDHQRDQRARGPRADQQ